MRDAKIDLLVFSFFVVLVLSLSVAIFLFHDKFFLESKFPPKNYSEKDLPSDNCGEDQLFHNGVCKPKIIELMDDYSNPNPYILNYLIMYVNDTSSYDFSGFSPLISKVNQLTSGLVSGYDKAYAISNWVFNSKYYTFMNKSDFNISDLWFSDHGVCQNAARLNVAMLRAAGIPAIEFNLFGHEKVLANLDGTWFNIDSTFHKRNVGDADRSLVFVSEENMRNRFDITLDDHAYIFDNGEYCNFQSSVCSSKPFSSYKIFMHPSIESYNVYFPAENVFIPPLGVDGKKIASYSCFLKIKGILCSGNSCSIKSIGSVYTNRSLARVNVSDAIGLVFGMNNFDPISYYGGIDGNIGYVHLRMPEGVSYEYSCSNMVSDSIILQKSGSLVSDVVIRWDNVEMPSGADKSRYLELTNHIKSLTKDLGITV